MSIIGNFFGLFQSPGSLLRKATRLHDAGDLEKSITTLHKAYKAIRKEGKWSHPIEIYLRLPLYLQEAGHPNEAWKEFNNLLRVGYFKEEPYKECITSDASRIYDKMRLFLHREKNFKEAVSYGLASHFMRCKAWYMMKEVDLLLKQMCVEEEEAVTRALLKKAKCLDLADEIMKTIAPIKKDIGNFNPSVFIKTLNSLLGVDGLSIEPTRDLSKFKYHHLSGRS